MSVSEPPEDRKSPSKRKKEKTKRKLAETPSMAEANPTAKRRGEGGGGVTVSEVKAAEGVAAPMEVDAEERLRSADDGKQPSKSKKGTNTKEEKAGKGEELLASRDQGRRERSNTPRCRAPSPEPRGPALPQPTLPSATNEKPVKASKASSPPSSSQGSDSTTTRDESARTAVDSSADSGIVISEKSRGQEGPVAKTRQVRQKQAAASAPKLSGAAGPSPQQRRGKGEASAAGKPPVNGDPAPARTNIPTGSISTKGDQASASPQPKEGAVGAAAAAPVTAPKQEEKTKKAQPPKSAAAQSDKGKPPQVRKTKESERSSGSSPSRVTPGDISSARRQSGQVRPAQELPGVHKKNEVSAPEEALVPSTAAKKAAAAPPTAFPFPPDSAAAVQNSENVSADSVLQDSAGEALSKVSSPTTERLKGAEGIYSSAPSTPKEAFNTTPKPFSPDAHTAAAAPPSIVVQSPLKKEKTSDSVASAMTLSSSASNTSVPQQEKQQQQQASSSRQESPGVEYKSEVEKAVALRQAQMMKEKDSKVVRAAAYWNNFIGDVIAKNKPPDNVKSLEKPKKISSAGVGSRGMTDLKSTFENGKPKKTQDEKLAIMRRNSKKMNLEGCTPGLKVTDAKSVFESKKQPQTPSLLRRNSTNSSQQPKWAKKSDDSKDASPMPFGSVNGDSSSPSPRRESTPHSNSKSAENTVLEAGKLLEISNKKEVAPAATKDVQNILNSGDTSAKKDTVKTGKEKQEVSLSSESPREKKVKEKSPIATKKASAKSDKTSISKNDSANQQQTKPAPSPKPKLKIGKKKEAEREKVDKGAEAVLTVSSDDAGKGLLLTVKKPDSKEASSSPPGVATAPITAPSKEPAVGASPQVKSPAQSDQEAKLAAVGVISREVFKRNAVSKLKDGASASQPQQGSKSVPVTPVKDFPKNTNTGSKTAPTSPEISSLISTMPDNTASKNSASLAPPAPPVPEAPPTPPASADGKSAASVPKIKTISPAQSDTQQSRLEAVKNSLKKVPHAPAMGKKKVEDVADSIDKVFSEGRKVDKETTRESAREVRDSQGKIAPSESVDVPNDLPSPAAKPRKNQEDSSKVSKDRAAYQALDENLLGAAKSAVSSNRPETLQQPEEGTKERFIPITVEPPKVLGASVTATAGARNSPSPGPTSPSVEAAHAAAKPPPSVAGGSLGRRNSKKEHYIPINVEGRGTLVPTPTPTEEDEASERRDTFHPNSLSRQRWGSRKKRISSAYSDSSVSDDENSFFASPFGGLQRYSSLGKHGLEGARESAGVGGAGGGVGGGGHPGGVFGQLRRGRAPFSMQRAESFSSEEGDDDFGDDDGFREMTAENLFSTLMTRVRSLTKRIHDEHDQHLAWQQTQRIVNHPLNPGGTHARLERNARRSSVKNKRDSGASTPVSFSRQSSVRDEVGSALSPPTVQGASAAAPSIPGPGAIRGGGGGGFEDVAAASRGGPPERILFNRGISRDQSETLYSDAAGTLPEKRYDRSDVASDLSGSVSVTSKQRLRPGYLPPPHSHLSSTSEQPPSPLPPPAPSQSAPSTMLRRDPQPRTLERTIPITIVKSGGGSSTLGSPMPPETKTTAADPVRPVINLTANPYASAAAAAATTTATKQSGGDEGERQKRRVSRFLRPDFYETSLEEKANEKVREVSEMKKAANAKPDAGQPEGNDIAREEPATRFMTASVTQQQALQRTPPKRGDGMNIILPPSREPENHATGQEHQQQRSEPVQEIAPPRGYASPSEGQFLSRALIFKKQAEASSGKVERQPAINSAPPLPPLPPLPTSSSSSSHVLNQQPQKSVIHSPGHFPPPSPAVSPVNFPVSSSPATPSSSQARIPPASRISSPVPFSSPYAVLKSDSSASASAPATSPASPPTPVSPRLSNIVNARPVMSYAVKPFRRMSSKFSRETAAAAAASAASSNRSMSREDLRLSAASPAPSSSSSLMMMDEEARDVVQPLKDLILKPPPPVPSSSNSIEHVNVTGGGGGGTPLNKHQQQQPPHRRQILPYGGAKSDGLLNKHAFVTGAIISAAERRKMDSYSRSSTSELPPIDKVI